MLPDMPPIDTSAVKARIYVPRPVFNVIQNVVGERSQIDKGLIAAIAIALGKSGIENVEKIICRIIGSSDDRCITNLPTLIKAYLENNLFAQEEDSGDDGKEKVDEPEDSSEDFFGEVDKKDDLFKLEEEVYNHESDTGSGEVPAGDVEKLDLEAEFSNPDEKTESEEDQSWVITKLGSQLWSSTIGKLIPNKKTTDPDEKIESEDDTASLESSITGSRVDPENLLVDLSSLTIYQDRDDSTESVKSPSWRDRIPLIGGQQPTLKELVEDLTDALDNLNRGGGRVIGRFESSLKTLTSDITKGKFNRIIDIDINAEIEEGQLPLTTGVLELFLTHDRIYPAISTMNQIGIVLANRSVAVVESGDELESSVTIDQTFDEDGYRRLIEAINDANLTEVWRYLIDPNGNINHRTDEGETALEIALEKYNSLGTGYENKETKEKLLNIIKLLLLQGAQPSFSTIFTTRNIPTLYPYLEYQRTSYFPSWQENEGSRVIIDDEGQFGIILEAAENGDSRTLRYALPLLPEDGVNYQSDNGRTALSLAAENGHLEEALEILLDIEGVQANLVDNLERTHFAYAVINTHLPIVQRLLLVEGIDVNAADVNGNVLLHHVILRGRQLQEELSNSSDRKERRRIARAIEDNEQILEMLLKAPGIEVDAVNRKDHTPLSLAAKYGLVNLALRLMHYGQANIDATHDVQTIVERIDNILTDLTDQLEEEELSKDDIKKINAKRSLLKDLLGKIDTERKQRSLKEEMDTVSYNPLKAFKGVSEEDSSFEEEDSDPKDEKAKDSDSYSEGEPLSSID